MAEYFLGYGGEGVCYCDKGVKSLIYISTSITVEDAIDTDS